MKNAAPISVLDVSTTLLPSPATTGAEIVNPPVLHTLPAMDYLLIAARLAELYDEIFPNHPAWLYELADWKNEEQICASVTCFLERVSKLFPVIPESPNLDIESIQSDLEFISIAPVGFDIWHDDWDQYHEPVPYLLYLMHMRHLKNESAKQSEFERRYPEYQVPKTLKLDKLVNALHSLELPEPLNALPALIRMLNSETNNLWLDLGYIEYLEYQEGLRWEAEEVAYLTQEWQEAEPIYDHVLALLNWQNETDAQKKAKLTAVRQALLDAADLVASQKKPIEEAK